MAIIYSYPLNTPKREDLLIGTVTYDENAQDPVVGNPTVSFTVGSLLDLVASQGAAQNLQQVTNIGNTTTNSIVVSNSLKVAGGYYDSSNQPGTLGQLLSSTATGTQWVNVAAQGVTSVGLSMPAAFTVANSPITQSGILTVTGAGTAAQYINGLGSLVTFPTIPTPYVLPVATTVALGGIKIGYTQNAKNYPVVLSNEQAYVNVPWTDTPYVLPLAASGTRGGVQIGYTENAKNYPVELDNEKMFVNVPWTDTPYVLPVATASDLGGVKIGYTENAKNYPVELASDKMFVNVPWTDTQTVQTITGTGSDNTDSGVLLSNSGGTVLILGAGSVAASQTGNTITLTGTDTDTGVTGVTLATGTSTGAPLSESIANRELTLTSFEYDGGSNIGYVPAGGTATTYLKGDGSWGSIPTGLQFKGTWDASGGGGGNPDLTQGANKGAGFLWICDVAGTAYPNGGSNPPSTWALGDWAVYDGTAWTRVPATNAGVTSITTTDGTFIDLTPNTATTGAVTVTADLSAQDGTSDTSTRFLSKDNTWDVPSYTTDTNTQNIYTNSWQQSTNDIILRKVLSGAGSGTQDIKIVKGANITFTYTDANNFTIAATDTQENTTWTVRDSNDDDKTVNNLKYLKFVTATGALDTALTGAGSTSDPYLMTLTSPDTNTQNTYTAGAGLSVSNFVFSADIDTTAASSATNNLSTDSGRYYAVQLDNNSTAVDRKMVVNVPWSSGGTYDWTIKDNSTGSSAVDDGESIQFVTATGPLGTALTEPTAGNFVMTLTSPDTTTNTTYDLAGAADGSVAANYNLVLSADGTAQDTMVFKEGSNVTFTRAANSLTIAADNDNTTYDFLAVQTGGTNDDPALRLDPSTGNNDDVTLTGGSNMTITRNSDTQITFTATNTWLANTKTVAGYVAAPGAVANKVWKTDANGNPAWRDDATGDNTTYSIGSGNTKVITLTGSDSSTSTVTFADGSDISISGNNGTITITNDAPDSGLPAVLTDGANPGVTSLYANTAAATVRATIGAGTGDGLVTSLTTTGTSGAATLSNAGVLNIPNYDDNDTTYSAGTGLSLSNANVFSIDSTVVTLTGTQTLTNKTLTTPVIDQISPSAAILQIDGAGSVDGGIKLMCYAGTHGQLLKSQPHSAGVTNTMLLPAGSSSTLVSEVSTSTLTNKSGNISMWTNDSGYITSYSETDTLQNVCSRGSTTNTSITMNGSGASGYLYVAGNAASAAPTNSQGMAFAYNNSGGSRENEIFFNPGIVTPAQNATYYFALINEYLNSSSGNARVTDTLFKLYGNGNLELTGPAATSTIANTYWRMPKSAAPGTGYYLSKHSSTIDLVWTAPTTGTVTSVATGNGLSGGTITTSGTLTMSGAYTGDFTVTGDVVADSYRFRTNHSNPTTSTATFYDQANEGPTISGFAVCFRTGSTPAQTGKLNSSGTFTVSGDIVAYGSPSDVRLKENIKPIKSALDKVSKLQGVTFDWKNKSEDILDIKEDIGFIAQDVQKVLPELVRKNDNGMLSMRHQGVTPILLEAIKELKAEIEELKKQIK